MDMQNGALIIRQLHDEVINGGRLDLIDEIIADDFRGPAGERGPSAFRRTIEGLRAGFPDIHYTIEDLIAAGDRVVVRWTWRGTHTGRFRAFAPSGIAVSNTGIAIYRLGSGRVVDVWLESDRLGFLEQLGVVPAPPSSGVAAPAPPARS